MLFGCLGDFFICCFYEAHWRHSLSTSPHHTLHRFFFLFTLSRRVKKKKKEEEALEQWEVKKEPWRKDHENLQSHAWLFPPLPFSMGHARECKIEFHYNRLTKQPNGTSGGESWRSLIMCTDLLNFHFPTPIAAPWKPELSVVTYHCSLQCNKHNTERYDSRQHN